MLHYHNGDDDSRTGDRYKKKDGDEDKKEDKEEKEEEKEDKDKEDDYYFSSPWLPHPTSLLVGRLSTPTTTTVLP